jgi:uncharacterized protein (TIGR03067 family)
MRLLSLASLLALLPISAADPSEKGKSPLEGTWVIESAKVGDMKIEVMGKDKKEIKSFTWVFSRNSYKAFVNGSVAFEEGTFRIDPEKAPKHLDLMPTKGEVPTTQKCLYAADRDELKIALTVWFAPSTPDEEIEEVKKMRATRPTSFNVGKNDPVLVLILKRKKD